MTRVLIAEDEDRIGRFLEKGLRAAGYATETVTDGDDALRLAATGRFDLLLLDLGLPRRDGFDVLARLRREGHQLAIIILTARDGVGDTVAGLEGGADDYLSKPFRFEELLARIRARTRLRDDVAVSVLRAGDAELDLRRRQARVDGTTADLSPREFALAEVFFRRPGELISREELLRQVWGYDFDPRSNVLEVYVSYLRGKLGKRRITSVRGFGYRLADGD